MNRTFGKRNSMASIATQSSTITSIMEGALNLLYIGTYSINQSVSPIKFFPHDKKSANKVTAKRGHFSLFVEKNNAKNAAS